jgi:plastocyanin
MRRVSLALMLTLVLAACGGDEETPPAATGDTGATTGATGATGAGDCVDLASGDVFTITISDLAFHPDCLSARAAQSIAIVNEDSVDHTFTIDGTPIDVTISGGDTFNGEPVTGVLEPGTYDFHCRIHPSMTGTITVE